MDNLDFLRDFPVFSDLEEDQLAEIYNLLTFRSYHKGETIFLAGDEGKEMFFLREGQVKITRNSADGREHIVKFVEPGEVFGEVVLFGHNIYPATTVCLQSSKLASLSRHDFRQYFIKNPEIGWGMLETMARKLFYSQSKLESMALQDSMSRIIQSLLQMAKTKENNVALEELNQQQLASYLGLTRETVSRNLSKLKEQGLIASKGRKIILLDKQKLKEKLL